MNDIGCIAGKRLFTIDGFVMRGYCDQWSCPTCRKRLAYKWARNIYYGACLWRPRPLYFITLTMPGWMTDPGVGYRELPKCWDNWRKQTIRKFGWFVYAAFVEEQQENRDMPHLHIITLTNMPTRLNELALNAGFGFMADNSLVSGPACAFYVSKYASKSLRFAPKGFRRVRISNVWPRLPEPDLPKDIIQQLEGETLKTYIWRVAAELGYSAAELFERYDNEAIDVGQ